VLIEIGCHFVFELAQPTHGVLIVEPHPDELDRISHAVFTTTPAVPSVSYRDVFGNRCRRLTMPAGRFELGFHAEVDDDGAVDVTDPTATELSPDELPDDVLVYLLPSRYCQSDQLAPFAFEQFGSVEPGWTRVHAISEWVHNFVRFDYGLASPSVTAADVLANGHGVCRDFTHLAVALCRALNIPTRYVFGYLPDIAVPDPGVPMDFCAWMEVWLGDRWYTFDPRNHEHRIGRCVIGRGRDAADVAMVTTFGQAALQEMTVVAREMNDSG
jgi:transglutaminase-like putative cysteine protease